MYEVEFTIDGEADLARLDAPEGQRVLNRLSWFAENFDAIRSEALTGLLQGLFKLRVGDYRVLYSFERANRKIVVHHIRHRREVYKRR